ncbi:MAG: translocation/assembly module TamB domain-containing protein [Deltaproteobacteria bacterium]|nr:translocation/assembly module TamB domain-containing protein [Deltaproteobacteria bacterium]
MSARKWIKRILLGLLLFIVVAVGVVLVVIHTNFGRELIRKQVEARLDAMFLGGGTVGKIEGSPFNELTIKDLVINGPDGAPAITAKKVKLGIGILPLISKKAILSSVIVEDLDVRLARDQDGNLQFEYLLRPTPDEPAWSVSIPTVEIHRAHVAYDTGTEWLNFDNLEIIGGASMMFGRPLTVNLSVRGALRERAVGLSLDAVVKVDHNVITVPSLIAQAGIVVIAGVALRVELPVEPTAMTAPMTTQRVPPHPLISGTLIVNAPALGVELLVPGTRPPTDIALAMNVDAVAPFTKVSLLGQLGVTPVRALVDVNLGMKSAKGMVSSGLLDLTLLTGGRITGTGAGVVLFEAGMPEDDGLPKAAGIATVWGDIADVPDARASIAFHTGGDKLRTVVSAVGKGMKATVEGQITMAGDRLNLDRSTIVASSSDPARSTNGKAPVHGAVSMRFAASGVLLPQPNLAVSGRMDGQRLRFQDLQASKMKLAIEARGLPRQPSGKAELELDGIVRGNMHLGQLRVTAGSRSDGRIAVSARSKPKQNPWLFDVDALVTPPGRGEIIAIDLVNHHIRAGAGGDWYGTTGHIEIGPRKITVRDLSTKSQAGAVSLAGQLDRLNGDFAAKVDTTSLTLDNITPLYRGTIDAHVDIVRKRGQLSGTADVKASAFAVGTSIHTFDLAAKVTAGVDKLVVDASASSADFGSAKIALDVDPPKDITNVDQWKRLHRKVIRTGQVSFEGLNVGKLAKLAGLEEQIQSGVVDGDLQFSTDGTDGTIQFKDLMVPALKGTGLVQGELRIVQTAPDEVQPTLTGRIDTVGNFAVTAKLGMPDHLFDPAAWQALGPKAMRGATARIDNVAVDPAQLERFGIVTTMRGSLNVAAEITEAFRSVQVAVDVRDLRGSPIAQPVQAHFAAAFDEKGGNTTLAIRSGKITLLDMKGAIPMTLTEVRKNPRGLGAAPLHIMATLPQAPAPQLLALFGRSEITGGTISGTVNITGTIDKPLVVGKITGTNLSVPPGPRNRPVKTIESLVIDGSYDGVYVKLKVDGVQKGGTLKLVAEANPDELGKATVSIDAKDFDLAPLLAFAPGPAGGGAGRLDAKIQVNGLDPGSMRIAGDLHLDNARIPLTPELGTLRRAKIDIAIDDRVMKINMTGRLGGGDVNLVSTFQLDGSAMPVSGDVALKLRKVSPIGTIEPDITADVTAKLKHSGDQWYADVFIKNGQVNIPKGRTDALDPIGAPNDMVFMSPDGHVIRKLEKSEGAPRHASLIANITLYSTHVISEDMRTLIKGKVTVRADAHNVGIVGSIHADRGDLDLFGRRYRVEQAAVHFDGTTDPLLDIRITHDFSEVSTITVVRGRLSKPELIMSSDPGIYSQGQLLGFLLGGEPGGDPRNARDTATSVGASFVANRIGGYVKKALPLDIDVLRYEAASASSGSAVLIGKWLTRSLFVAYRQHLEARVDENRVEGELEYWLSRRVSVEAMAGDRGHNGVDLLWRKRY